MAGNIKGITITFRGDTTQLDKALRSVDKETASIDSELKKVNNALKFNPTSVELWSQKQTLLKQKITETSDRLKALKAAQAQMDAKNVDKNSKEYRNLQREIITTESKLKNFKAQLQAVGNVKLRVASEQLKQLGSKATAAGQAMRGISRAAGVVAASIGALAYKSGKWADNLNTMSKQYRIGTKQLQLYSAAANLVDVSTEDIAKSHVKLTKNMLSAQTGSKNQAEAFKKLGVSIETADGELRDSDEVWQETIKALGSMKNETERDALAMRLMGGAARNLNPLIADSGETYKRVAETMKKYGLDFVDQKTLDKANEFNDKLDTIKAVGLLAFQTIGAELAEVFAPILEKVVQAVGEFAGWFTKLNPVVIAVAGGISLLVAAIAPALLIFGALASAAGTLLGVLAGISAPILAIVAAVGALAAAFISVYASSSSFRKAINEIVTELVSAFKPVIDSVVKGVKTLVSEFSETVKVVGNELGPVLTALMPIIKMVAKLLMGSLKRNIDFVIGVIRVLLAVVRSLAQIFRATFNAVVTIVTGAVSKIKNAFSKVKSAITGPFETAKNTIKGIVDKIKGFFPIHFGKIFSGLKLPHFTVDGGKFPFGVAGKGRPPEWDVDWYAKGGIFNNPSLIGVGEAGAEAVVPLDKLWRKLDEMNTAGMIVNVYGSDNMSVNDLAEAVEQKIIQMQKRRRVAWQ